MVCIRKLAGVGAAAAAFWLTFVILGTYPQVEAVPSFSRQTGLACSSCHTTPPELTPLGRIFKLNGYTMTGVKQITAKGGKAESPLAILEALPISAFFQVSNTSLNRPQPGTQNGNFELPQAASLFLAGEIAAHTGSFIQVTYDTQADHFSWDNSDLRYANQGKLFGKSLVYGVTLNNNPTVEDLWNSTPAWGFPWVAPDAAPAPLASAVIAGPLAQDVAGLGAYGMWDDHLYGDFTLYRSEHIGAVQPPTGAGFQFNIRGVAPYWRGAWQQSLGNNYLEAGTYGMHLRSSPNNIVGPEDDYTDVAVDTQYERTLPWKTRNDVFTLHSTYIHERADLFGMAAAQEASQLAHHLNTFRADGTYHMTNRYAATVGYFNLAGNPDSLLYAPAPVTGSATGIPDSDGLIAQFAWWPVQNVELAAQYTDYLKFNGLAQNYDGAGRNASGNNALYLLVWFIF